MATQPRARIFLSSSPQGRLDSHAVAFDRGDDDFQLTAFAETWSANPSISEAETHALEPDEDTWGREYKALPWDGTASSICTETQLLAVTRRGVSSLPYLPGVTHFAAQDPATRQNEWTLCVARAATIEEITTVTIVYARGWRAPRGGALDSNWTLAEIADVLRGYHVEELWQDQWSFDSLAALAERHGISLRLEASTQASKVRMFDALRRRVIDGTIGLIDDPVVRADILGVRRWVARNGSPSIELERVGGRHCDHASSVATVVSKAAEAATGTPLWATPEGAAGMRRFLSGDDCAYAARRIVVTTSYITGTSEARPTRGSDFSPAERATWRRGERPYFQNASRAFQEAVTAWMKANA